MGMARRGLDLSVANQLSGQALTERQGVARTGVLEVVNSFNRTTARKASRHEPKS